MKKLTTILLLLILNFNVVSSIELDDIDYNFLARSEYSDHVPNFAKLFQHAQINSLLEFGLGYSTKYLLDHCKNVTSCEIIMPDQNANWFNHTSELFAKYPNWTPILKQGDQSMHIANHYATHARKNPALQDGSYLLVIKEICDELFKDKQFDVAFVDPGFHMRGDLVNELFDRVPIIVAHDTNIAPEIYGWDRVYTPSNYVKIVFAKGQGTTFWIHKDKANLIAALGGKLAAQEKKMRIFFPIMHHTLIESVALALQHLGHTLVVPGETFSPSSPSPGFKLHGSGYLKKKPLEDAQFIALFSKTSSEPCPFLKNIEVIENYELIDNPPDVLVVNCEGVENDIYSIFHFLLGSGKKRDVKLVHYSGNNGSQFNRYYVKNLIAVDAFTPQMYASPRTNIVFWIPWINFDSLCYNGFSDKTNISNFLSHYYEQSFIKSASIFHEVTYRLKQTLPQLEFASPKFMARDNVLSLIDENCATFHIKETEGFGYTIVESLAKGRPVFLKRSFSLGSRLMNWSIEGKTAFFFDDYEECERKVKKYLEDREYRHQVQNDCAKTIRALINNEKQARILENFLQNLN
jgi:hypothetical protein